MVDTRLVKTGKICRQLLSLKSWELQKVHQVYNNQEFEDEGLFLRKKKYHLNQLEVCMANQLWKQGMASFFKYQSNSIKI